MKKHERRQISNCFLPSDVSEMPAKKIKTSSHALIAVPKLEKGLLYRLESKQIDTEQQFSNLLLFRCPDLTGIEKLPLDELRAKMKEHFAREAQKCRVEYACQIIKNCNSPEDAQSCIANIRVLFGEVLREPDENKYKYLMQGILRCSGGADFLEAMGFFQPGSDEEAQETVQQYINLLDTTKMLEIEVASLSLEQ